MLADCPVSESHARISPTTSLELDSEAPGSSAFHQPRNDAIHPDIQLKFNDKIH